MTQYLIDTPVKLATCNRCSEYVFACDVNGVRTMADPIPLGGKAGMRDALLAGKRTYKILYMAGKPWKLQSISHSTTNLGADGLTLVADHSCGMATANNRREVEVVPEGPQSAPVTLGRLPGGSHPLPALAGAQTGSQGFCSETSRLPTPATPASLPRSDGVWRCERCRRPIDSNEPRWSIEVGNHRWAMHDEECVS